LAVPEKQLEGGESRMAESPVIWLVGSECDLSKEKEYNKFYNQEHMPTALKAPGMTRGTRYERVGRQFEYPQYLAIYEIESEAAIDTIMKSKAAAEAAEQQFHGRGKELGMKLRWLVHYRLIGR
jgi:hypothetical protein